MENEITADFLRQFDDSRYPAAFTDRYEAMECLSCKQHSETLLVREKAGGRRLVAKCCQMGDPMFEATEPEELHRLSHPGLPAFVGEYRGGGMRCILREYIDGQTLWERRGEVPFPEETVRETGIQLCDILMYLHSQTPPVIHRDIKPQNIVLREDGSMVLIDLEISRLYVKGARSDTVFCGTQDFAPPEQYGFLQTDCRSDIYSMGILLAWMLTGEAGPLAAPATPLERVITKCTAFTPDDRFRDAAAVRRALGDTRPSLRKRKRIWRSAGALALILLLVWGIWRTVGAPADVAAPGNATAAPGAESVVFAEPLIEQAVRLALNKADGDPISPGELGQVTELFVVKDTPCPNTDAFYADIGKWCETGMQGRGSMISLDDLSRMPILRKVCIGAQQIADISPLAGLAELVQLDLRFNDVSDLTPLAGLEKLEEVGLNANPVADLTPLTRCPALCRLDLCDVTGTYDPSILTQLGDLDFLDLSNPTDSYLYLGGKTIRELKLSNTTFADLSFLRQVEGLERLEVCHGQLADLSELEHHPELTYLRLCSIPATDYSVLGRLPKLQSVPVDGDRKKQVEPIAEAAGFSVNYQ